MDFTRARYVDLHEHEGLYTLILLDGDRLVLGHGYKGPSIKRAQQDLKYWTREKGLEQLSARRD